MNKKKLTETDLSKFSNGLDTFMDHLHNIEGILDDAFQHSPENPIIRATIIGLNSDLSDKIGKIRKIVDKMKTGNLNKDDLRILGRVSESRQTSLTEHRPIITRGLLDSSSRENLNRLALHVQLKDPEKYYRDELISKILKQISLLRIYDNNKKYSDSFKNLETESKTRGDSMKLTPKLIKRLVEAEIDRRTSTPEWADRARADAMARDAATKQADVSKREELFQSVLDDLLSYPDLSQVEADLRLQAKEHDVSIYDLATGVMNLLDTQFADADEVPPLGDELERIADAHEGDWQDEEEIFDPDDPYGTADQEYELWRDDQSDPERW
jgi:hypothetical protein